MNAREACGSGKRGVSHAGALFNRKYSHPLDQVYLIHALHATLLKANVIFSSFDPETLSIFFDLADIQ